MSAMALNAQSQTTLTWGRQIGTDKEVDSMNHVANPDGNSYHIGLTGIGLFGKQFVSNEVYVAKLKMD